MWLKHRTRSHRVHAHPLVRPRTFLCGLGEKKVQLCSASYSFLCQMGRIRVTCSVDTLQATNELMPQKILDIVEIWSLEGTISSASYNNCTCGSFHSLLWECSNEGKRKRKSCGSGLRYNDRIMRRTREDKRNTLLTPLMQDSGGHRLCTDQAYILCYSILFYFVPFVLHSVVITNNHNTIGLSPADSWCSAGSMRLASSTGVIGSSVLERRRAGCNSLPHTEAFLPCQEGAEGDEGGRADSLA